MPDAGNGFVIDIAIEPRMAEQWPALRVALEAMRHEGSIGFRFEEGSGQAVASGTHELSLDIAIERLRAAVGEINVGAPQIAYRETIARSTELDHAHRRPAQFARIKFRIEPCATGTGLRFASLIGDGRIPDDYVAGIRKGVESAASAGPVIGFPMIHLAFTLLDGAYHDTDSSAEAFEIAARIGFREAVEKALPRVMEPIMRVEIIAPEGSLGEIISDLQRRRGQLQTLESNDGDSVMLWMVPLAGMFGYVNSLRAISDGYASYTMAFDHYEMVPDNAGPDDRFPPAMAMRA